MRVRWDEAKRRLVLNNRGIDFAGLDELLNWPYVEDQRHDDPEQYRIVGFANGQLITFIVEYRQDMLDEYIWVVTAWHSTKQEQKVYEQETK